MNQMYNNNIQFEQSEYIQPQFAQQAPVMEGYNPNDIEHDAPYIPRGQNANPQYRYNYPNMPQQPMHGNYDPRLINQQQLQQQKAAVQGPSIDGAYQNFEKMTNVVNLMKQNGIDATADGSDVQSYGMGVALETLASAIKTLNEVEYWIPESKQHLTQKLLVVGQPIVKVLEKYITALESLK